jgi:hypothetical protein
MKLHKAANILFALGIIGLFLTTLGIGLALAADWHLPWWRILGSYIILLNATIGGAAIARAFDPTRKP